MGLFNTIRMGASAAGDYEVERSLRFNDDDSAYLSRTPSGSGNRKTFTYSCWFKRGNLGTQSGAFLKAGPASSNYFKINIANDHKLYVLATLSGAYVEYFRSTQLFRDPGAWMHLVVRWDTTDSTAAQRVRVYINGSEIEGTRSSTPGLNLDGFVNHTDQHEIGASTVNSQYWDGYIAEVNLIDGSSYDPSSFAKTDPLTGRWSPKKYAGSYGTNGFYLNFSDNSGTSATTLGKDYSGNGNNFTPNNFSVAAGTGNDSVTDTPTNNFPTFNPIDTVLGSLANGNLDISTPTGSAQLWANFAIPKSGKWYMETTMRGSGAWYSPFLVATNYLGLQDSTYTDSNLSYYNNGDKRKNNSETSYGAGFTTNDVIAMAIDVDNSQVTFYKNGSSQGTISFTFDSRVDYYLALSDGSSYGGADYTVNFGQRPFANDPPTGFEKLCSANLPDPIKIPNKYFDTLLYTGNGSSGHQITGLEFQPDFAWVKRRDSGANHGIYDVVTGVTSYLRADQNNAQDSNLSHLSSFNSDGFTLGADTYQNTNSATYVAWNWKAGGSASSNGDGSTTSSVSANTTAGFSIVTYTGTGSTTTIGHGLGVAPKVVMTKSRSASGDWAVLHMGGDPTAENRIVLNDNGGYSSYQGYKLWNDTAPTSSVFTVREDTTTNASGVTYVAYCFSEVEGYIKFGRFNGNGSSDGRFIFLGFRPAWFVVKRTNASNNWRTFDAKRSTFNEVDKRLYLDTSGAESTGSDIDFLSNGVKMRNSDNGMNASGGTYMYLAFAEFPFKYSRAR